jgi:hypothetical protein
MPSPLTLPTATLLLQQDFVELGVKSGLHIKRMMIKLKHMRMRYEVQQERERREVRAADDEYELTMVLQNLLLLGIFYIYTDTHVVPRTTARYTLHAAYSAAGCML